MRLLVWQWGRFGAGPRYAAELAAGLREVENTEVLLSLSAQAEILAGPSAPDCDLAFPTYTGLGGLLRRLPGALVGTGALARRLKSLRLDAAICAMPAPLDLFMASALRRAGIPFLVVVHDAERHPGDGFPIQMTLQRLLIQRANGLVALSTHVADRLRALGLLGARPLIMAEHPPFPYGPPPPPPRAHGGKLRLLCFGRLLPYKGLDLLAEALELLGPRADLEVRVAGSGPESPVLDTLRRLPGVMVENRWVPEPEVGDMLAWSDALVLSHREASQSGVAAAAVAARRWVVATRVGGIAEQLRDEPMARLCEPNAPSLASAIRGLIEATDTGVSAAVSPVVPPPSWRRTAERMVAEIRAMLAAR
jgi:glycosyltransferase involved in cell wall biosynthesis